MYDQNQKQEGGDNSINVQGKEITIIKKKGLSKSKVKQIAIDLFKENFLKLQGEAYDIAFQRFDEITNKIFQILQTNNPDGMQRFNDPAIQYSLYNVQKEYAKSGDQEMSKLLVELFIQRINADQRTTAQISLDEAIKTIPKLTNSQLDGMALNYCMTRPLMNSIEDIGDLDEFLNEYLSKFIHNAATSRYDCTHIVSLGCGILSEGHYNPLSMFFREIYGGFFQKGLDQEALKLINSIEGLNTLIMECFHDPQKKQLRILNHSELEAKFKEFNVQNDAMNKIRTIFSNSIMGVELLINYLKTKSKNINSLIEVWDNSELIHLELTSLGDVIARTYIESWVKTTT